MVPSVVEMVKEGDARACADAEVQKVATVLIMGELPLLPRLDWSKYLFEKKRVPRFDAASMVGLNRDISEVECSATWLLGNDKYPLIYKVRPPADGTDDFVVQVDTTFLPSSITESLKVEVTAAGISR
jgi:hypothetical protein